jgi:hypothetical protein
MAGLWIHQGLQAAHNYVGTCGLLDAGWACSKAQYVEFTLLSAFVFPLLAAVGIGWLIVVAMVTLDLCSTAQAADEHIAFGTEQNLRHWQARSGVRDRRQRVVMRQSCGDGAMPGVTPVSVSDRPKPVI